MNTSLLFVAVSMLLVSAAHGAGYLSDNNLRNDLVYNSSTGSVRLAGLDLTGTGPIVHFSLATAARFDFTDGQVTTGLDCALILPAVACGSFSGEAISYDDPTHMGINGALELGRILPTGLTAKGVQGFLTEAYYRTANISSSTEFDIRVVPEPSGILTAMAGLVGVEHFRRRKRR